MLYTNTCQQKYIHGKKKEKKKRRGPEIAVAKQTRLEKMRVKLPALNWARSTEHNILGGGGTLMNQELPWESTVVKSSVMFPNISEKRKGGGLRKKYGLVRIVTTRDLRVKWNKYLLVMKYLKGSSRMPPAFAPWVLKEKYALELDVFKVCMCVLSVFVHVCAPATGITSSA